VQRLARRLTTGSHASTALEAAPANHKSPPS
jgi:hypothetical protein